MKIKIFISIALVLFFSGCGKKYYEPKNVRQNLSYDASIPDIVAINNSIIQLEDGSVITDNGLLSFKLKEGEKILNINENDIAIFSKDKKLIFYSFEGEKIYEKSLNNYVVLATKKDNLLVTINSENFVKVEDSENGDIFFEKKYETAKAISNKIASILFYNSVILIPTLDGRLIVLDKKSGNLIKDFAISSKMYFNNIIYLNVLSDSISGDKLIVATSSKIVSMLGEGIEKEYNIKKVLSKNNKIYILTTEGEVLLLDKDLNLIDSKKYKYATFSDAYADDDYLYIIEKKGHLIINTLNLKKDIIYTIPDEVENYLFMNNKNIFYEDSYINLKNLIKP